ncbi:uncharacterized protein At4g13200, chloroplastic-like [Musa acuminata AAA Group]|uniref:uncharacterized protein At4g13200, chloroplastic-like n=1 Tax=Musa acuminata AAA Group TaxID=214697 RepID=UPI0031D14B5F
MAAASASLTSSCTRPSIRLSSPSPRPPRESLRVWNRETLYISHPRRGVRCSSSSNNNRTPYPGSDKNDSRIVLDAFFLGKAFAEALNERIESTVGEILSVVGQWQAEQQKQVQDFQEEVIVRAKKAKERAALEVMTETGVLSKPSSAPLDNSTTASPNPDPKTEDPLQEMLKD